MKITIEKIVKINEALSHLAIIDELYCSYEIAKNLNLIKDTVDKLNNDRKKLIDLYILKDKNGVYKTKGKNNELNDFGDNEIKFTEKVMEMLEVEIDIEFIEIAREDIKGSNGKRVNPPAIVLMPLDEIIIK